MCTRCDLPRPAPIGAGGLELCPRRGDKLARPPRQRDEPGVDDPLAARRPSGAILVVGSALVVELSICRRCDPLGLTVSMVDGPGSPACAAKAIRSPCGDQLTAVGQRWSRRRSVRRREPSGAIVSRPQPAVYTSRRPSGDQDGLPCQPRPSEPAPRPSVGAHDEQLGVTRKLKLWLTGESAAKLPATAQRRSQATEKSKPRPVRNGSRLNARPAEPGEPPACAAPRRTRPPSNLPVARRGVADPWLIVIAAYRPRVNSLAARSLGALRCSRWCSGLDRARGACPCSRRRDADARYSRWNPGA